MVALMQAHILNACFTGSQKAETLMFENAGFYGGIASVDVPEEMKESRKQYEQTPPVR